MNTTIQAPASHSRITGLILAGGLGRRMGNVDKGLEPFRGRTLVESVIERFRPQVATLIISANRNLERYRACGFPVVPDRDGDFAGPLAGLQAGLAACATPLLATAPCDSPFLPADLVARLLAALTESGAPVAVARCDGHLQPVFLLVRREAAASLDRHLAGGERKAESWLVSIGATAADFPDPRAFTNFNTRDALQNPET
ncbi:MAG TPA: molybdenum cofactor guanylyltransferase MobA [Rhodocyclaceae bacterium]|nr:molybdenum cofactor guanylyltransferase MobA [Rhodocyclaceae bacterium]